MDPAVIANLTKTPGCCQEPKFCRQFKCYCPVQIKINHVACYALLDSGNLVGNIISLSFLKRLGFTTSDIRPLPRIHKVGTAKAGTHLEILGEVIRPISLRFGGSPTVMRFQPLVAQGLVQPINISGPFLAQQGIDQLGCILRVKL